MMRHTLLTATAALAMAAAAPADAQDEASFGFESGTLSSWTATGDAFARQPTFGNNVARRRPGESPGQDRYFWVGTYENFPIGGTWGAVQGDGPQGTLTSAPFVIDGESISFLVGGGRDPEREYVALLVKWEPGTPPPPPAIRTTLPDGDYFTFLKTTGRDDEHMMRTIWPVTMWRGKTARFQIVDRSSAPWGHINADSFQLSWRPYLTARNSGPGPALPPGASPPTIAATSGLGTATIVQPQGAPATAYPVGGGTVVVQPPAQGRGAAVVVPPAGTGASGGGGVTVSPPSDQQAVPAGVRFAHYQLFVYRMKVAQQTPDDPLEGDGPGDEVRVRSDVFRFTPAGVMTGWIPHLSRIMGSEGHADIIAGNARPGWSVRDDAGGFRTGDEYPPPDRRATLSTIGGLPMLLWEGDLTEAGEAVVVVPSVWEIDSRAQSPAEIAWDRELPARVRERSSSLAAVFNRPIEDGDEPNEYSALGLLSLPRGGNQPLGWRARPGQPTGTLINYIVLTYNRAAYWAALPARVTGNGTESIEAGGMLFRNSDDPFDGFYELYAKLVHTR